jgi:hypothetical protein
MSNIIIASAAKVTEIRQSKPLLANLMSGLAAIIVRMDAMTKLRDSPETNDNRHIGLLFNSCPNKFAL